MKSPLKVDEAIPSQCSREWASAFLCDNVIQYTPSRPSRARELKQSGKTQIVNFALSRPSRARELKPV